MPPPLKTPVLAARLQQKAQQKRAETSVRGLALARQQARESQTRVERLNAQTVGKVAVRVDARTVLFVRPERVEQTRAKLAQLF